MKIVTILVICGGLLSGCTHTNVGRTLIAERAKTELVGKSREEILACAGVPARTYESEGVEYLTYFSGGDLRVVATDTTASANTRSCELTFSLKDGVVQSLNYTGRTGGLLTQGEQCAFAIASCVAE